MAGSNVSSWSKKAGKTISEMLAEQDLTYQNLAAEAGLSPASLKKSLEGTKEFSLAEFVMVANAVGYTPGGLLTKCLK